MRLVNLAIFTVFTSVAFASRHVRVNIDPTPNAAQSSSAIHPQQGTDESSLIPQWIVHTGDVIVDTTGLATEVVSSEPSTQGATPRTLNSVDSLFTIIHYLSSMAHMTGASHRRETEWSFSKLLSLVQPWFSGVAPE